MNIVVVCGSNRSLGPMVSAILRRRLASGDAAPGSAPEPNVPAHAGNASPGEASQAQVQDAGLFAFGEDAEDDAIQVMRERYGVDLQEHTPSPFDDSLAEQADFILPTDPYIERRLQEDYAIQPEKMIPLQIEDPYLHGRMAYEKAAASIEAQLEVILPRLKKQTP